MFSNENMNEMFTAKESVAEIQKTLAAMINAREKALTHINEKDQMHGFSTMALRMESMALTIANHTISELYIKTLRLERELAELRAQSGRFSA
ncbi:hypothetical protein [Escherichia coli]|uniref:hypothetical protein n=1 Tax=Escherichia coli TaxID=562 RepID=UPI000BEA8379|nr:hypothetical protein [Escherichia coli]